MSDPIVGIDLGTSNSVVTFADATGAIRILADATGYKIHPSVVSFHPNGGVIVGAPAKQRKVIDPANTIYSVKRLIGRAFSSPEVKTARKRVPYQIKEGANELPLIVTRGGEFAPPEISAIILDHVRNVASTQLGVPVGRAVVTVPASFNDAQRSATATAGAIAGLTVMRVLNEPTAAALAYGHARNLKSTIAVYDFGGGTFDITILRLDDQVYEVLGTAGNTFLGGDDLDERLVDRMVTKFLQENRIDLRANEVSMMRLRAVAEQTKIELSRRSRAVVRIDEIAYGAKGKPLNLNIEISRDEFVSEVADIIDQTFPVCKEALSFAGLGIDRIDDVILVGGTTKIPYVRDQAAKFFGKAPRTDVNPEDAVAMGAALQAASLDEALRRGAPRRNAVPAADLDEAPTTESSTAEVVQMAQPVGPSQDLAALTADYQPARAPADARTETEYLLPNAGAREVIAPVAPVAPPAGAIGRLQPRRTDGSHHAPAAAPRQPPRRPTPPAVPKVTMRGVAADWEGVDDLETTDRGSDFSSADDFRTNPGVYTPPPSAGPAPPASPPAMFVEPAAVPSAPPNAPTMMAMAPPVIAPGLAPSQPSAASTAPGFAPIPASAPIEAPRAAPVILDVTPRGLGIATVAGFCEGLIRRNSSLPTEMIKRFTTSRDQQRLVRIVVCQGESRRLDNNVVIGDLRLEDVPPRPRGETSIEVTFALDASGILRVTARDAETGREQRAALDLVGGVRAQDVATSRERILQLRR